MFGGGANARFAADRSKAAAVIIISPPPSRSSAARDIRYCGVNFKEYNNNNYTFGARVVTRDATVAVLFIKCNEYDGETLRADSTDETRGSRESFTRGPTNNIIIELYDS